MHKKITPNSDCDLKQYIQGLAEVNCIVKYILEAISNYL